MRYLLVVDQHVFLEIFFALWRFFKIDPALLSWVESDSRVEYFGDDLEILFDGEDGLVEVVKIGITSLVALCAWVVARGEDGDNIMARFFAAFWDWLVCADDHVEVGFLEELGDSGLPFGLL